jgi:DNA repair protein RecO (recombination protein O)
MEWNDVGIVLSSRKYGESSIILTLLTENHGRHLGLVRGGAGRRARGLYEPGNLLSARWRARISDHLGGFNCELINANAALLLDNPLKLAALSAACALAEVTLPERFAEPILFEGFTALLESFHTDQWPQFFVTWELNLLRELGFGLDLSTCASTGQTDELIYVSPRSGRSVSRDAGQPYAHNLLPLPAFLIKQQDQAPDWTEILDGFTLTSYFLEHHVLAPHQRKLPNASSRFIERIQIQIQ